MKGRRRTLLWAAWAFAFLLFAGLATAFLLLRPSAPSASVHAGPSASSTGPAPPSFSRIVGKQAPDFVLLDQFGRPHRMSSFRGKGVLLTFVSSRCTNICPLIAQLLRRTEALLGPRARSTEIIAVNANPRYTSVHDVLRWSREHSMTRRWLFLTGPPVGPLRPVTGLASVWRAYGITGGGAHTTLVFLIDPRGRVRTVVPIAGRRTINAEARALARYEAGAEARPAS